MRLPSSFVLIALFLAACGDSGGDSSSSSSASGSTGSGAQLTCASAPVPETIKEGVTTMFLTASGGKLYFIDAPDGIFGKTVNVMSEDGTGLTPLFTTAANHGIGGLAVLSDGIYFFDTDYTQTITSSALERVPLAGGAAEEVLAGNPQRSDMRMVESQGGTIYLSWSEAQGATQPQFIGRFDTGTKAITTMAKMNTASPSRFQLVGDNLYFAGFDASQNPGLSSLPAMATMTAPAPVGQVVGPNCQPALGFSVAATAIASVCGITIDRFDAQGANPQPLMNPGLQALLKNDGQYFYGFFPADGKGMGFGRAPMTGGPETLLTCGALPMSFGAFADAPRQDEGGAELAIADGYVFWATDVGSATKIVRLPIH